MSDPKEQDDRLSPKRTPTKIRLLTADELLSLEESTTARERQLPFREMLIEGLLSFGEKTRFEFGRLNILVGPNGSGKSNLILSFRCLRSGCRTVRCGFWHWQRYCCSQTLLHSFA